MGRITQNDDVQSLASAAVAAVYATTTAASTGMATDAPTDGGSVGALTRLIAVGTSGTLIVTLPTGGSVTLPAMPDGYEWKMQVKTITGGTAANVTVHW